VPDTLDARIVEDAVLAVYKEIAATGKLSLSADGRKAA
jgi:hypothetical protein